MVSAQEVKRSEDWENYFGFPDAAFESDLPNVFYPTVDYESLALETGKSGKFVVAGVKGSGKTAICRHIAQTTPSSLRWLVDEQNRIVNVYADKLGRYPQEVESVLLNWSFAYLTREILRTPSQFSGGGVRLVQKLLPQVTEYLKRIVRGTKVKGTLGIGPEVEFDFDKLFDATKFNFSDFKIDRYVEPLSRCFEQSPALILFDDIDELFMGADTPTYPTFVEGLLRAAKTVNLRFKGRIHFLVFIKYGTFRRFFERP